MNANSSEPARSNKAAVLLNELQKELELEARRLETERVRSADGGCKCSKMLHTHVCMCQATAFRRFLTYNLW